MVMDSNLIKTVNKLQDAFATVGVVNPIDLPQIAVIGSQSSGKSSVLENIVGRDFLPRGTGIVTRRPLMLQLINRSSDGASTPVGDKPKLSDKVSTEELTEAAAKLAVEDGKKNMSADGDEWGEFLHLPGKKFFDFNEIRDEIIRDTDRVCGKNTGVSHQPINLRVYSPRVLTLTLVDLPGLTKVPVGDQPKDIEKQIREMVLKYIGKSNAIILAVTAANTDLANSDGLKLAREVDPEGLRTIGVLTKIDLMDPGTDVVDILAGRVIPLRLGYVPVVNRGQRDIEHRKSVSSALDAERAFFENHSSYKSKAQYCGTPFLSRKLNTILMHHIRNTLPEIKTKIQSGLAKYQSELVELGVPIGEDFSSQSNLLLSIITEFTSEFRTTIEGTSNNFTASRELSGGARIAFVFHEIFGHAVRGMDPFDEIKDVDIRTIVYNSSGSSPALFVGTAAFEVLVKQQIKRLEDPSLKCVALVYDELNRILTQMLQKQTFKRFPGLRDKFYHVVNNFFKKATVPTNKMVSDLISAETSYVNTGHPDFISGHRAMAIVNQKMLEQRNQVVDAKAILNSVTGHTQQRGPPPPAPSAAPSMTNSTSPNTSQSNIYAGTNIEPQGNDGFFGTFFNQKKKKSNGQLETPPAVLKPSGNLSEREYLEVEVIKLLIQSYYNIVKRTVSDLVPKSIMLYLVNFAKDELQRELLAELYKKDSAEDALKESEFTQQRRKECRKMIEALQKADEIISTV